MSNIVLDTKIGAEFIDASNITLEKVTLISENTKPVISVNNSDGLTFNTIQYKANAELLFAIAGERSKAIQILQTDSSKAQKQIEFTEGATKEAITVSTGK